MKLLVKTIFGSSLFGTKMPDSDIDYKGIYIPSAKDILFSQVEETINHSTGDKKKKNTKDDVDIEIFSLKNFLSLAQEGQTFAFDMLFTPKELVLQSSPEWDFILKNKDKLIHSNVSSFIKFAINQADKYKEKGKRLKVLKEICSFLEDKNPNHKLSKYKDDLLSFSDVSLETLPANNYDPTPIEYMNLFNKKASFTSNVKTTLKTYKAMEREYGNRAKKAEATGVDFKSKYHAVRVACEATELLTTGSITFPRPEAPLLKEIREGLHSEEYVDSLIKEKLSEAEAALEKTTLPKSAEKDFWDRFIFDTYKKQVVGGDYE